MLLICRLYHHPKHSILHLLLLVPAESFPDSFPHLLTNFFLHFLPSYYYLQQKLSPPFFLQCCLLVIIYNVQYYMRCFYRYHNHPFVHFLTSLSVFILYAFSAAEFFHFLCELLCHLLSVLLTIFFNLLNA